MLHHYRHFEESVQHYADSQLFFVEKFGIMIVVIVYLNTGRLFHHADYKIIECE